MTTNCRFASVLTIAALVAGISWIQLQPAAAAQAVGVQAQQAQHDHAATPPDATSGQQMMMMRPDMVARMKAGDDRLQALVTAMNQAAGEAKIAAMAALLSALADERRVMGDGMMQMQRQMMDMRKSMQEKMAACPMMQDATGKN